MTIQEFKVHYDKLSEVYPNVFGNVHKEKAVWSYIKDLEIKWWRQLVERMLLSKPVDIEEAARGERLAKNKLRATQETLDALKTISSNSSPTGLQDALKSLGAKSLLEAIEIKKQGTK